MLRGGYRGSEIHLFQLTGFRKLPFRPTVKAAYGMSDYSLVLKLTPLQVKGYNKAILQAKGHYRLSGNHFPVYKTAGFYSFPGYSFGFSSLRD